MGKAKNLKSRVSSYFTSFAQLGPKTRLLVDQVQTIEVIIVESEVESLLLEAFYIKKFRPKYNIKLIDGKSYPLIRITVKDEYPVVMFARQMTDDTSLYFGPFPNAGAVKLVLKTVRKIFPFVSVLRHPPYRCLYYHLGLCPCPVINSSAENKKAYATSIKSIVKMLEGKTRDVIKDLEAERARASELEAYEEASSLQKKIDALRLITEPVHAPFEYDTNPNLRSDLRQEELDLLRTALVAHGLDIKEVSRIECYDISNIQGTNSTGSMVVLTHGEIDKSQYRKFKISLDGKPNDFAMMEEMLTRRLKHSEWPDPSLLLIDGGKGQVASVLTALKNTGRSFPVVGLAKREETLIIAKDQPFFNTQTQVHSASHKLYGANEDTFRELSLGRKSPALNLVKRIRDEAHRFAVTYHRKLRSKSSLKS